MKIANTWLSYWSERCMCAVVYLAELVDVTSSCWTRDLLSCTRVWGRPIPRVLRRSGLICVMKRVFVDVRDWSANDSCRCLMMQLAARWQRLPVHSPVAGSGYSPWRHCTAAWKQRPRDLAVAVHLLWMLQRICWSCCGISFPGKVSCPRIFHRGQPGNVVGLNVHIILHRKKQAG